MVFYNFNKPTDRQLKFANKNGNELMVEANCLFLKSGFLIKIFRLLP